MSLAERLAEPEADKGGRSCSLCRLLDTLDGDPDDPETERGAVERALRHDAKNGGWSARAVADALQAEGHEDIAKSTVGNHRREHLS